MSDTYATHPPGEERHNKAKVEPLVKVIALIATLGGLVFGYDTGIIAGALLFMKTDLHLTPTTSGLVTGALVLGAAFGAVGAGRFADLIGRKKIILILAAVFIFGSLGSAFSPNALWMIFFRLILGLSVGAAAAIVPVYIAEIVPARHRGRFVALQELMIVSGQLLAYTSSAAINEIWGGENTWRLMLGLSVVPAVLLWSGMVFLPDTPRWYAMKGRFREAREVLLRTRHPHVVDAEMEEIKRSVSAGTKKSRASHKKASRSGSWIKRLFILGVGIAVVQQLSGINAIIYYAPTVLEQSGMGTETALIATIGNGVISVVMTLVGIWGLGKIGRRPLLLIGQLGCTVCLLLIAAICYLMPEMVAGHINMLRSWAILGGMLLFLCFQQSALSPVVWLLLSEIFPLRIRGVGTGVSVFALWMTSFVIATTFPVMIAELGLANTFLLFAAFGIAGGVFVIRCAPETKGKSLEQVEKHLKAHLSEPEVRMAQSEAT